MTRNPRALAAVAAASALLLGCPVDDPVDAFDAELAGELEHLPVATPGTGSVNAELVGNLLVVEGSFEGLTSPLLPIDGSPAHIHEGPPGEPGPVLFNIDVDADADGLGGTLSLSVELSDAQVVLFRDQQLHVNIHTENYPAGELRADLIEGAPSFAPVVWDDAIELTAEDQPHEVDTDATGFATAILRADDTLVLSGAVEDLAGAFLEVEGGAVNLYRGLPGEEGELVFNLEVAPGDDEQSGTFHLWTDLTAEQRQWLVDGELFLNVHTSAFPEGELRGQLDEVRPPAQEITAELSGENEVPPVATPATGVVHTTLVEDVLTLEGSFEGLTSPLVVIGGSSAHIHLGAADEAGPVVFDIEVTPGADERSGTLALAVQLDEDQLADFQAGLYYVNIHTENFPAGELRAQLVDGAPTFAPVVWDFAGPLTPEDHVHEVITDATGFATAILREDDTFVISGAFEGLSSPLHAVAGSPAHIHVAPAADTGPIVFNVLVLSDDELSGTFHEERTLTGEEVDWLLDGQLYLNIHTAQYPAGELRVQLE